MAAFLAWHTVGKVVVALGAGVVISYLSKEKEVQRVIANRLVNTNSHEAVIAHDVVNPDDIDVKFDSIGGLLEVKGALIESVILPLRRPEIFSHGRLRAPVKGVLLYGPPGTGKTMLAKAIAKESGAVFINAKISNLMSKYFGESLKLVAALFSLANKLQPAIIFIDEVDSFLGQRRDMDNEITTCMKTEFMSLWDGFASNTNARVMVLAATNRPSALDEAILRRFTHKFKIGKPSLKERVSILETILQGERVEQNINYKRIATLCEGFSGSDILELCKQAAKFPVRDLLVDERNGKNVTIPRALTQSDMEKALSIWKSGKSSEAWPVLKISQVWARKIFKVLIYIIFLLICQYIIQNRGDIKPTPLKIKHIQ